MAKATAILQQQKLYTTYTKFELSALLMYRQMKGMSGMMQNASFHKWKKILDSKKTDPPCDS